MAVTWVFVDLEAILNHFQFSFWIYFLRTDVLQRWYFKWEMCPTIGNSIVDVPAFKGIAVTWGFVRLEAI